QRLRLGDRVKFLGWRNDVADLLAGVDAFVLASLGEGFGLSILEAMVHGLPVIATQVVAIPEIVAHGETGVLVPPRGPVALAEAIGALEVNAEMRARFGRAGQQRALDDFSVATMVQRTERVYREVLS